MLTHEGHGQQTSYTRTTDNMHTDNRQHAHGQPTSCTRTTDTDQPQSPGGSLVIHSRAMAVKVDNCERRKKREEAVNVMGNMKKMDGGRHRVLHAADRQTETDTQTVRQTGRQTDAQTDELTD